MPHAAAQVNGEQNTVERNPIQGLEISHHPLQPEKFSAIATAQVIDSPYSEHERETKPSRTNEWLSWENFRSGVHWVSSDNVTTKVWKPITLRGPILGGLITFSVAVIVILEVLAKISSGNGNVNGGGLVFAADVNNIPAISSFVYLYLPTVLAVVYSMLWSWVDLDTKRLEPWFQLSKEGGARAEDSLLLQYPFDFLPFVPLAAFRRKHWGVFFAGSTMLLTFWVITPLQSAIFNTGTVTRSVPTEMGTSATLLQIESQTTAINANFLNLAYGISWLNQSLPAYTTNEFATLPFRPVSNAEIHLPSETWKTTTSAYRTNLSCKPAISISKPLGYTFDNGNGCSVSDIALPDVQVREMTTLDVTRPAEKYLVLYIGYYNDAQVDYAIGNPNCTKEHSNNFLALFASASSRTAMGVYSDLTALFCIPTYEVQEMTITVNSSSGAIVDAKPISDKGGPNTELLETTFNKTIFEYILGAGVNPETDTRGGTEIKRQTDLQDLSAIEQYPRVQKFGVKWPLSNMVGFAIALNPFPVQDLVDPVILQRSFERAHQILFTSAFSILTQPNVSGDLRDVRPGVREGKPGAIILVREIGIAVEVAFGMVALLTMALWYISRRRASNLCFDPASIANVMSMTSYKGPLSANINDDGTVTMAMLENALRQRKYHLLTTENSSSHIQPLSKPPIFEPPSTQSTRSSSQQSQKPFTFVRPLEHRLVFGAIFASTMLVALAALVFLDRWGSNHNGISLPSNNPIVRSIIENYAPTAFATFLEPIWIILSRLLCLLQPFEELRKGNASSSKSVEVKYTSLPPQLAIWRAFRAKHFLLAVVCFVAVSTNILAVTLAALLNESPVITITPFLSSQTALPQFTKTSLNFDLVLGAQITYRDHFYVALSNITGGNSLPPWLDSQYFYLPFDIMSTSTMQRSENVLQSIQGSTLGIGAEVTCVELLLDGEADKLQFDVSQDGASVQFSTSHTLPDGSRATCISRNGSFNRTDETLLGLTQPGTGTQAMEIMEGMVPSGSTRDNGFCASLMVAGWVRIHAIANDTITTDRLIEKTFLGCRKRLKVARFDVAVDVNGRVIASNRTSNFSDDTSQYFKGNATEISLFGSTTEMVALHGFGEFAWHNDSFTSDWINSLMGAKQNSTSLVDPRSPLPNVTALVPIIEGLYEQLFAIILGLNADAILSKAIDPIEVIAQAHFIETRLFVSPIMFKFSVIILSLHFITAILYYSNRPRRFLPRMPTSIASIIAYVSTSRALEDFEYRGISSGGDEKHTYAYGRFIGTDGKTHVGIERQRYVVPLKSRNPEVRRKWSFPLRKDDERLPKTWI